MVYFSSDWHLGHANIIKYDDRPFRSVEEMNEVIITNVTKRLNKGDSLYFLGDFALTRSSNEMEGWMKDLSYTGANLYFIKGNHDKADTLKLYNRYGTYLGEQKKIKIPDLKAQDGIQEIVLNHYRMDVWDKSHHSAWHLHGHSHHSLPERTDSRCIDVGINGKDYNYDLLDYQMVSNYMAKKTYKPIDHHGRTGRI